MGIKTLKLDNYFDMQTRLSIISNIIFKYFVIFAIIFMWLNFYSRDILSISLTSIILTFIIGKIIGTIGLKRKNKLKLSLQENKKIQEISFQLFLNSEKENLKFFHILLKSNDSEINIHKLQIENNKYIFVPLYNTSEISEKEIFTVFQNNKNCDKKIIIGCINFSQNAKLLIDKIQSPNIHLLDINQTFALLKKYDFYPEPLIPIKTSKKFEFKMIKKLFFAKQNAKHYLFSAIIILITSFFIRYNIYYIAFATLLFIFSAICKFKPNITQSNIIDEL